MSELPDNDAPAPAPDEAADPRDHEAPVAGAKLVAIDPTELFQALSARQRAKVAKQVLGADPDMRRRRRDTVRAWLTGLLFVGVIAEALVAVSLAMIWKTVSWDQVKDWLLISLVPLTAAAGIAGAFWFPTKETE